MFPTDPKEVAIIHSLFQLTLSPYNCAEAVRYIGSLSEEDPARFIGLAHDHHVVVRCLNALLESPDLSASLRQWATEQLAAEQARIDNALPRLNAICDALEEAGSPVVVMKSLDHDPDLGNDLDLLTLGKDEQIIEVMKSQFKATVDPRSWGDRIAHKWNFSIPGLREAVEVHVRRLGQMGEHIALARRFVTRRGPKQMGGYTFLVPAPEERIIVATLQRMYRHFYFRVCDIVNTANLVESGMVDWSELHRASDSAGIWPGVATYLKICSDKVALYRQHPIALPDAVLAAAQFGADTMWVGNKFLRIPLMPHGARLYTEQVTRTALRGDVPATFRLSLFPTLASVAVIAYKLTGSEKGVW
jgi:putative nucleotidyltransferase-like protein